MPHRAVRVGVFIALLAAAAIACSTTAVRQTTPGRLATGTWGGDDAGVIVDDTVAHVHVGCTFGNAPGPIALDASGRFSVSGSYMLRAYPIAVGPSVPARFDGRVVGNALTITVTVNDTVEHQTKVLGPKTVTLGVEPKMGPCPICRVPRATP